MPTFWRLPLPKEQSNPGSPQDIYSFPDLRTIFWSNHGSWEYPSRPSWSLNITITWKKMMISALHFSLYNRLCFAWIPCLRTLQRYPTAVINWSVMRELHILKSRCLILEWARTWRWETFNSFLSQRIFKSSWIRSESHNWRKNKEKISARPVWKLS